jgi:hypothetical protein
VFHVAFACLGCLLGFSEDGSNSNGVCLLALETCATVISGRVCEVALTQVYVVVVASVLECTYVSLQCFPLCLLLTIDDDLGSVLLLLLYICSLSDCHEL